MDWGFLWGAGWVAFTGLRWFSLESGLGIWVIVGRRGSVEALVWILLLIHGLLITFALLTILHEKQEHNS